jgi:hypothetical protein
MQHFKDAVYHKGHVARSVCSDVEFAFKDNMSVDGSASVMDAGMRKRATGLTQLFAWANKVRASELGAYAKSPAPSQQGTPRASRGTSDIVNSDVVELLNGFGVGGMQF